MHASQGALHPANAGTYRAHRLRVGTVLTLFSRWLLAAGLSCLCPVCLLRTPPLLLLPVGGPVCLSVFNRVPMSWPKSEKTAAGFV